MEGNDIFNDVHNTFYLWLYGIGRMVKDHSERGNPLLPLHRLLFLISSKGSFICTILDRIAHTLAFVRPVMEHWLEGEIAQWGIDPMTHHTMSRHSTMELNLDPGKEGNALFKDVIKPFYLLKQTRLKTLQYIIFNKIIFFKYRIIQIKATETNN